MIVRSTVVLVTGIAGTGLLATGSPALVTVAQRDGFRSVRAPRTTDVSADGRLVAFESLVRLVPADTDDSRDIYVLDRTTRLVTLESEGPGDGTEHSHPRISGDGRYVVFESRPPHVMNTPRADIVLRDRIAGTSRGLTTTALNQNPYGWSRDPDISDDGRVVAFSSAATTLTDGPDVNGAGEDIYLVQVASGTISRASVTSAGVQPDRGESILPSLSADGRWVAFASTAPLDDAPLPAGSNLDKRPRQVYLRDAIGGRTTRVSRAANGGQPNGTSWLPTLSADGRRVAFASDASNLLDDDDNRASDVFLYDREADAITWVSRAVDGSSAGGESTGPVISGNGRFIAFQSDAANLVCARRCSEHADDINLLWDTFLFDSASGVIVRTSEDELGGWMEPSAGPALDATGQVVAFSSRHPVDAADRAGDFDLFVRALTPPPIITRRTP